ncbi:hypothetical protein TNCV_91801 [Trichonephila clavipes]|nr:hypothetical protein TNCV_91801 [Trichonephila clavipes]
MREKKQGEKRSRWVREKRKKNFSPTTTHLPRWRWRLSTENRNSPPDRDKRCGKSDIQADRVKRRKEKRMERHVPTSLGLPDTITPPTPSRTTPSPNPSFRFVYLYVVGGGRRDCSYRTPPHSPPNNPD